MFETVSPEAYIRRDRFLLYETLPVSLALHAVVVGLVIASTFVKTAFPDAPPRLSFSYRVALDPPPPPPPPPPPAAAARPVPTVQPVEVPLNKIVAPTVIPDVVPVFEPPHPVAAVAPPAPEPGAVDGGVAGGIIGGAIGGVVGGAIGGSPRGVLGGLLLDDGRVHFAKNTPLPLYVEHQEYPEYPEKARSKGVEDSVTVRYTIDKRGRVKDIIILDHATQPSFDDVTLAAIKSWRFRPLMVDGEAREVVHDLTVFFRLK